MGQYENSLGKDHQVVARVVTEEQRAAQRSQVPPGVILQRDSYTLGQSIAAEGVLYQSGIPFWIPPGDGGANGLSFTGTRGVFTLSAAAPMQYAVAYLRKCYCYLPAGAGGLAAGGWYWCEMSDDTNGEIFAETYSSGKPLYVGSPTQLANLSAGRITQTTNETTGPSFTLPGGSMGPNGILKVSYAFRSSNSAGTKVLRVKLGASVVALQSATTSNNVIDSESLSQNQGVQSLQNSVTQWIGRQHNTGTATLASTDVSSTVIDTAADQTIVMSLDLGNNTDALIGVLRQVTVQYGA